METPPFHIGQKVVYVTGKNMPKNSVHTVLDVKRNGCGCWHILVQKKPDIQCYLDDILEGYTHYSCNKCRNVYPLSEELVGYWRASSFRPAQQDYKTITYSRVLEETNHLACVN